MDKSRFSTSQDVEAGVCLRSKGELAPMEPP